MSTILLAMIIGLCISMWIYLWQTRRYRGYMVAFTLLAALVTALFCST